MLIYFNPPLFKNRGKIYFVQKLGKNTREWQESEYTTHLVPLAGWIIKYKLLIQTIMKKQTTESWAKTQLQANANVSFRDTQRDEIIAGDIYETASVEFRTSEFNGTTYGYFIAICKGGTEISIRTIVGVPIRRRALYFSAEAIKNALNIGSTMTEAADFIHEKKPNLKVLEVSEKADRFGRHPILFGLA